MASNDATIKSVKLAEQCGHGYPPRFRWREEMFESDAVAFVKFLEYHGHGVLVDRIDGVRARCMGNPGCKLCKASHEMLVALDVPMVPDVKRLQVADGT